MRGGGCEKGRPGDVDGRESPHCLLSAASPPANDLRLFFFFFFLAALDGVAIVAR